MKQLIIEKPSLAPFPQRVGWAFFTVLFWMLWIYLWMPLITILAWAMGIGAYEEYFRNDGGSQMHQLGHIAMIYTSVICALGGGLLLWARVEFLRFENITRRVEPITVTPEEIAEYAALPVQEIETWRNSRRVAARHDEHGRFIGAKAMD